MGGWIFGIEIKLSLGTYTADKLEELISWDYSIQIFISPLNHILQVLLADISSDLMGNTPKISHADKPSLPSIEQREYSVDILSTVPLKQPGSHQMDKLLKSDATLSLGAEIDCQLINGFSTSFWTQCGDSTLDF